MKMLNGFIVAIVICLGFLTITGFYVSAANKSKHSSVRVTGEDRSSARHDFNGFSPIFQ